MFYNNIIKKKRDTSNSKTKFVWSVLTPALLFMALFSFFPLFFTIFLSFNRWDFSSKLKFVGFNNFKELFTDAVFRKSVLNTTLFAIGVVIINVLLSILIAYALSKVTKGITFYKTTYYLPVVMPMIPASILWIFIFNPLNGLANQVLNFFKLPSLPWLSDSSTALLSIIIMTIWKTIGKNIIILLAGILQIPKSYTEAAQVDGAKSWTIFSKIIIPILTPVLLFVLVTTMIDAYQVFDQVYVMTSSTSYQPGGPSFSTYVLSIGIYLSTFKDLKVGSGAAQSVILLLIVLLFSIFIFKYFRSQIDKT